MKKNEFKREWARCTGPYRRRHKAVAKRASARAVRHAARAEERGQDNMAARYMGGRHAF